jgi:hypothetical protein
MKGQIRHITEVNSWTSNSIVRDGKTIRNATTQPRGTRGLAIQTDDISWIGRGSQIKFDHPQIRGMYKVDDIFDVTDGTQVFYVWTKKYQIQAKRMSMEHLKTPAREPMKRLVAR